MIDDYVLTLSVCDMYLCMGRLIIVVAADSSVYCNTLYAAHEIGRLFELQICMDNSVL